MTMKRLIFCMLLFSLGIFCSCAPQKTMGKGSEKESDILSGIIRFYQGPLNHLSAVRRGECPMHPSCSVYAEQSVGKHGPYMGWMMTCDRLMRCGRDETRLSPKVFANGKWKYYDPVGKNDFSRDDKLE